MADVRDLYQEVIFEHNKNPRNFGVLAEHNRHAVGHNPLCGDQLTIYLEVDEADTVQDVKFEGSGCAISVASASLMTQIIKGKSKAEAEEIFQAFHDVCTKQREADDTPELGKLSVLTGVRDFPSRVKCATLAWHTVHAALEHDEEGASVTTE
ncbi:Fe-S cluster assembly sulfur transfer protein SufU [Thiohalorhabdus methylotrophus]|uniref:Fe-S cluster assembly sulfur transfer protein SufU n=1 Tax=Thiohalorhabdus methylotrophus TaxID=3242694 RepID=A0ABV4TYN8_9GAMM